MTNDRFARFSEDLPAPEPAYAAEMDLARSVQVVCEEIMMRMARTVHRETQMENLCMAGRCCPELCGKRARPQGGTLREHLDPAGRRGRRRCAGCGSAHLASRGSRRREPVQWCRDVIRWRARISVPRSRTTRSSLSHENGIPSTNRTRARSAAGTTWRSCWPNEKIMGWFDGRMEFGPRALGSRSILGDPRSPRRCRRR
jgi:carbamoyltransferase